jgi:hypothetical protein
MNVKEHLMSIHQRGFDDGLAGVSESDALRRRIEYVTALERELYGNGYSYGNILLWATAKQPPTES